ncbi:MAG: phosphatidate cytidylyltransferase [Candidatus Azotimanducaceae bacterium]|jgi:phosphatidate cytidylyltransferase
MLKQRIITALFMAPIAIACTFFLPIGGFSIFLVCVLMIAAWEWANFAGLKSWQRLLYAAMLGLIIVASGYLPPLWVLLPGMVWWSFALLLVMRYPHASHLWARRWQQALLGPVILVPGYVGLLQLKLANGGNLLILLLFFLVWGADVGAYFSGRRWGRAKLAPQVSPGKSWAGFYGGLVLAMLIAVGMTAYIGRLDVSSVDSLLFLLGCGLVVMLSVLGDLVESMFKRQRGIKDSSQLLPGHGGFLDRLDSLLAASPSFALLVLLTGG